MPFDAIRENKILAKSIWTNCLGLTSSMLHTKPLGPLVLAKKILKGFFIHEYGSHFGHMTKTISIKFG